MKHSAVEGLLRGLGVQPDGPEMAEVLALCGASGHLPPELPVEQFCAILEWAARRFFPTLPREAGLFQCGYHLFTGYRQTLLGQIQLAALHLMGPDRLMRRGPEFVGRNSNFGQRTSEQLGPHHFRLSFRGVPIPGDYYLGLLTSGLEAAGVEHPRVSFQQVGPEDMDFEAAWGG
jgi:uncharacterized protein (TIGR02265 family)